MFVSFAYMTQTPGKSLCENIETIAFGNKDNLMGTCMMDL